MKRRGFLKGLGAVLGLPLAAKAANELEKVSSPDEVDHKIYEAGSIEIHQVSNCTAMPGGYCVRQDVADIIYKITPQETPFMSAANSSHGRVSHEWAVDELTPIK